MSKTKKKAKANRFNNIYLVGIILLIFVLSTCVLLLVNNGLLGNSVADSDVVLNSDTNTIIIKSMLAVDDSFGKSIMDDNGGSYGFIDFFVENTQNSKRKYQFYLIRQDVLGNEINSQYLRFYLTDQNDNALGIYQNNVLPSYNELNFIMDKPNAKLLYSDTLEADEVKKMRLRVWVTSNYVIKDIDESFSFEIGVRAV